MASNQWSDPTSQYIVKRQYALGKEQKIGQVFHRVANYLGKDDAERQEFYDLMYERRFMPGGRILAGAGSPHGNLVNCFVQGDLPGRNKRSVRDVQQRVMDTVLKLALVTKTGGGNGVNLDEITCSLEDAAFDAGLHPYHSDAGFTRMHLAYISPDHPDYAAFQALLSKPSNDPDGEAVPHTLRNFSVVQQVPEGERVYVVKDSIKGIFDAAFVLLQDPYTVHVFDFSELRGAGTAVKGSGGSSSGPTSFLVEIFDNFAELYATGQPLNPVNVLRYIYAPALRVIRQMGIRRGAGMATMSIGNGYIEEFIDAKTPEVERELGDISTFNLSVLSHGVSDKKDYPKIWKSLVHAAHASGEPGIIFIDRVNEFSVLGTAGEGYAITATNPCGELPLLPGESCVLGAMVLPTYVDEDGWFNSTRFTADVRRATRFLNRVLHRTEFALPENRERTMQFRRIGLGVMGLADTLIAMDVSYGSLMARDTTKQIMDMVRTASVVASERLVEAYGESPIMAKLRTSVDRVTGIIPRANIATVTIAPTGTTSMVVGTSSGIEPIYSILVYRRVGGKVIKMLHPAFREAMQEWAHRHLAGRRVGAKDFATTSPYVQGNGWNWSLILEDISIYNGSIQDMEGIPSSIRSSFVVAHDISPQDHVFMQAAAQHGMDGVDTPYSYAGSSVSKTCNLPHEATIQDVDDIFLLAATEGCKGIAVYRDGSRQAQVLNTKEAS